ncbi:AAA family ATPase [Chloroflexota bacterium]
MVKTNKVHNLYTKIMSEVSKAVIGKDEIKEALMLALIAGGHVLIEGFPGTAKTKLARSFAEAIGGQFKRIQFTPDMMPADVTGFYIYSPTGEPRFNEGPIFANVVLADELNRTTPRTQAALLEAMQEYQVTIERKSYPLEKPFIVIATQVHSGAEGTYPLTDVQMDRFVIRIFSEYLAKEEEKQVSR